MSDPGGTDEQEVAFQTSREPTDDDSARFASEPIDWAGSNTELSDRPQPSNERNDRPGPSNEPIRGSRHKRQPIQSRITQAALPVARGLGWPLATSGTGQRLRATGLGWPVAVDDPSHVGSGHDTVEPQLRPPSNRPDSPVDDEEIQVSQENSADRVDPTTFGPYPAPGSHPVVTAAEFASHSPLLDDTTPLAKAAAHRLLVTEGVHLAEPLPKPEHTRIVVVANQKGGVGKTTSAVNIAAALAQHGLRVLVVDLDPQGNASTALSLDHSEGTAGVYEVVVEGAPISAVVSECDEIPGLFAVPASIDLAGAEIELVSLVARESRLRKALDLYLREQEDADVRLDFVFIDCPPSLGLLTVNALVAGRELLIPIQCEYYALEGLGQLLKNIDLVKAHLNPELEVSSILLTMYDGRTRLASGVADEVRNHFGDAVLSTVVPRSVRISEAPSYGQTVMTYDPGSPGALSYLEAAREIATRSPESAGSSH